MARYNPAILLIPFLLVGVLAGHANARNRPVSDVDSRIPILEASPILAPFQHVRFCLRYPSDCKSDSTENERIALNDENSGLINRVNRDVNASIIPMAKDYGSNLQDGWTISPATGDCNDYAVTKRHELLQSGLPAKALRLSVVRTASGIGHLVLVVVTNKGDLVLDNLTETIRPWQNTDYQWLKIQSATDARYWYEVRATDHNTRVANR